MRKEHILSEIGKFKGKKVKAILTCTIAMTIVLSSTFSVFAAQDTKGITKSLGKFKIEIKLPVAKPVQVVKPAPVENKQTDNNDTLVQKNTNNESTKNQSVDQSKAQNNKTNTVKKDNTQVKQSVTKKITYKSKGLGIAFDMPADWANKYEIQDSGMEVMVISKCLDTNIASGILFLITNNTDAYSDGSLSPILGNIHQVINGKQYLVGGPKDIETWKKDPNFNAYKTMQSESVDVLKSIRAI